MSEVTENGYKEALNAALRYITGADHTEYETRQKLLSKEYTSEVIDDVIEYLKQNSFINDKRYAAYYIVCYKDRRSALRIETDLKRKGIDESVISECMEEADMDSSEAVFKALKKQLQKRKTTDVESLNYEDLSKIYAALSRQGYSPEEIRNAIKNFTDDI